MTSSYDAAVIGTDLIEDPRLLRLPRGIRLLHLEAIVWCKARRTDGAIVEAALRRMTDEEDPDDAAADLVRAGLWERTDDGWQVADFTAHQLSRHQVEERQAANRKRYEDWRRRQTNASPTDTQRVGNGAVLPASTARLPARDRKGRMAVASPAADAGRRRGGAPRPRKVPWQVNDVVQAVCGPNAHLSPKDYGALFAQFGSGEAVRRAVLNAKNARQLVRVPELVERLLRAEQSA